MEDRWPEGVITLVLTDVVGSTRTWEAHPGPMAVAMARHDAIAADVVDAHGGALIKGRGEGLPLLGRSCRVCLLTS